jgi:hypothetical protein
MKKKKVIVVLLLILLPILSVLAITIALISRNVTPEDSAAIYGGQLEQGYPYVGYLVSYLPQNQINVCGTVYLDNKTAISAAHCVDDASSVYLGDFDFSSYVSNNYETAALQIKQGWDRVNSENDLAVLRLKDPINSIGYFATVASPELGCNYIVVGYGQTENKEELAEGTRLRKSAELCIEKIENNVLYIKGQGGGICYGDSGSPIFEKDTNKLVGIISGIYSTNLNQGNYCDIDNTAIVVRLDTNIQFINSNSEISSTYALCGQDCLDKQCADSLTCKDNICSVNGIDGCEVSAGQYCSPLSNINCKAQSICINNKCVESTSVARPATEYLNIIFTGISDILGNSDNAVLVYVASFVILLISVVLFVKVLRKK